MARMNVAAFLDEIRIAGWQWGERDCLLWLGLWSERVTGIDGGAEWRGRYRTALGCMRVLNKSGGMESCIERGATAAGMREGVIGVGSVGLVNVVTPRGVSPVGTICTGPRWAVMMPNGVLTTRAVPVRAWGFV